MITLPPMFTDNDPEKPWANREDGNLKVSMLVTVDSGIAPGPNVLMRLTHSEVVGVTEVTQLIMTSDDAKNWALVLLQAAEASEKVFGPAANDQSPPAGEG